MISGRTRQWGQVRHFLGYREDTRSVILLDKDDIPERYLADLDRSILDDSARLVSQLKLIAKDEGIKIGDLANLLQVDWRTLNFWATGERTPATENYNAVLALRDRLINSPDSVRAEIGTKRVPTSTNSVESTPTQTLRQSTDPLTGTSIDNSLSFSNPIDDKVKPGPAQCDKCKLKGAEGGRVEGRG